MKRCPHCARLVGYDCCRCTCGYKFSGQEPPAPAGAIDAPPRQRLGICGWIASWIFGLLVVAGLLGVGIVVIQHDAFFFLGFAGVYSIALLIGLPLCAFFAFGSLVRKEPCSTRAGILLILSLLSLALTGSFAYQVLTSPPGLFH